MYPDFFDQKICDVLTGKDEPMTLAEVVEDSWFASSTITIHLIDRYVRLKTIWPFPGKAVRNLAKTAERIIVPEMNHGQISCEVQRVA
jgi:hypothetical protein